MITKPFSLPLLCLFLLVAQIATARQTDTDSSTPKQDAADSETETATDEPERPKLDALMKILTDINTNQHKINLMFANIPVGFPKIQQAQLEQIRAFKAEVRDWEMKVYRAAIDAYVEAPNENPIVNQAIVNALSRSLEPKSLSEKYDPKMALEIANLMIENNNTSVPVLEAAFRAAYGLQDFDLAQAMLDKLVESKQKFNESLKTRLADTLTGWEQELKLRAEEKLTDDLPRVEFDTTAGKFTVELFENQAPNTVANFINLVEKGFYDENAFHLVIPGRLVQTGCPQGNVGCNPGYRIECECYEDDARHHFVGSLSMLNNGKDTGGSVFFITHQPNVFLDGKYTVFGRILGDIEPLYQLNTFNNALAKTESVTPSKINKITVVRKRAHPYVPTTLPLQAPIAQPQQTDSNDNSNNSSIDK